MTRDIDLLPQQERELVNAYLQPGTARIRSAKYNDNELFQAKSDAKAYWNDVGGGPSDALVKITKQILEQSMDQDMQDQAQRLDHRQRGTAAGPGTAMRLKAGEVTGANNDKVKHAVQNTVATTPHRPQLRPGLALFNFVAKAARGTGDERQLPKIVMKNPNVVRALNILEHLQERPAPRLRNHTPPALHR